MSRVVVINHLTLDGVMQAPGRPDEDRRGGFAHGGWAQPTIDEVMGRALGGSMARGGPMLLGRRTYEDFHGRRTRHAAAARQRHDDHRRRDRDLRAGDPRIHRRHAMKRYLLSV